MRKPVVWLSFVSWALFLSSVNCVILHTKLGKLKGDVSQSRGGRVFYSFYSIPYAEPPVGALRFKNPVPAESWEGIRDATVLPPVCIQDLMGVKGQEDCLYLNIYTPKLTNETLLPVMVFIYGGRFMYNDALPDKYGAHYFMDRDVILVTFHYRLGVLGFLSTEDEVLPGNYAMKDIVAVLQWVQKYINDFGGDKNRVTLFGGSSGGISASLVLISPLAEGLVHRVISQSGHPFDMEKAGKARLNAWKLGSLVGCEMDRVKGSKGLLDCLMNIPAEELVMHNDKLSTFGGLIPAFPWGPVVENEKVPGAFLVDEPSKLLERKSNIPWIMGINSEDGGMIALFTYFLPTWKPLLNELDENYKKHFPWIFRYGYHVTKERLDFVTESFKNRYFGEKNISDSVESFEKMFTNLIYVLGIKEAVKLYKGPKYVYYYAHNNKESFAKSYCGQDIDMGVIHGDELVSFYNWTSEITPVTEGVDLVVSEQMLDLWTNFAARGDPNYENRTVWNPVSLPTINFLHIKNGELEMKDKFLKEEIDFFESLPIDGYF